MTVPDRLVVDASAAADAVLRPDGVGDVVRTVLATAHCHAPHLIDAELGSILRRLMLRNELGVELTAQRLGQAHRLVDVRHEMTGPLTDTAWRLRHEITFYDALYVALAIGLGRPLLTSDGRLAAAARAHCAVLLLSGETLI